MNFLRQVFCFGNGRQENLVCSIYYRIGLQPEAPGERQGKAKQAVLKILKLIDNKYRRYLNNKMDAGSNKKRSGPGNSLNAPQTFTSTSSG